MKGIFFIFLFMVGAFFSLVEGEISTSKEVLSGASLISSELNSVQNALHKHLGLSQKALVGLDFGEFGFGSGVLISPEGLIATAAHVTAGIHRPVVVILSTGERLRGVSLGVETDSDLALVQIEESKEGGYKKYPYVPLSAKMSQAGDWVYALGHSHGWNKERGGVLRLGKILRADAQKVQTDCSLIAGDSGGPLFNLDGEVIAIHSRIGQSLLDNIHGLAIVLQQKKKELLAGKWLGVGDFIKKKPAYLGMELVRIPLEKEKASLFFSDDIVPQSAWRVDSLANFWKKGNESVLHAGDVIVLWDGQELATRDSLQAWHASAYAGMSVTLSILQGKERVDIEFILGENPFVANDARNDKKKISQEKPSKERVFL